MDIKAIIFVCLLVFTWLIVAVSFGLSRWRQGERERELTAILRGTPEASRTFIQNLVNSTDERSALKDPQLIQLARNWLNNNQ